MIPSLQVFIYTVSLAALLCVMVTVMTPTTSTNIQQDLKAVLELIKA